MPTDSSSSRLSHEEVEGHFQNSMDWPQYYASGESVEADDFVPAYYRVEGPNGPVSYVNPNGEPCPTTMHDFAMEAQNDDFHWVKREETPWPRWEDE